MEYRISELLDDMREVDIDIQPNTLASASRIKELTMKKIHKEENQKKSRRGLSTLSKIVLVAAVLATLALPVMAATGFQFSDWLDGLFQEKGASSSKQIGEFDGNPVLGGSSKNWDVSGWVFEMAAKDVSAEGLTVVCEHHTNQAQPQTGTVKVDESFWIEKWNGEGYDKLPEPKTAVPAGKSSPVAADSKAEWKVNWSGSYGTLEPGSYRLGKNLLYTSEDGKQETVESFVKFRVFNQDMAPIIAECKDMLEALRTKDSYHLTQTYYAYEENEYDHYTSEIWKNGENYLEEVRYVKADGSLWGRRGYLYRDGKGYELNWAGDTVLSGLASWESVGYLDSANRDMWMMMLEVNDNTVGKVAGDENTTTLVTGYDLSGGQKWFNEISFTQNEKGELTAAQAGEVPDIEYTSDQVKVRTAVEVHDTDKAEIAKVIAAQAVGRPVVFSWEEEQAKYTAGTKGVKTEDFVNTASRSIEDADAAIAAAQKECTMEFQNTAVVSYDEGAKMWKVELGFSADDAVGQTVYLTGDGITKLVVTK